MSITTLTERYFHEKPHLDAGLDVWLERLTKVARSIDANSVVSGRVKSYRSFLGKAYRDVGTVRTWERFGDLIALKAVFPTARGVKEFSDWLMSQDEWEPVLDTKPTAPNELKYQSMQFDVAAPDVCDSTGAAIKAEVQVRTAVTDAWYVVDHRLQYKGIVGLPDELKRKIYRLIVLTELFDEEVEAVMDRQSDMPEYATARLYEELVRISERLVEGHTRTSRPEGLLELMLTAYTDEEVERIPELVEKLVEERHDDLANLLKKHHHGSSTFVEHRDWMYYEPEVLLIAERALTRRALLTRAVENSDFEATIKPMITEFLSLK